ncbi:MAG TPA: hypothetical protein VOA87_01610 [Thermoanaerobaculia bacterium]|nr:hypothetical protein [Thermoanaerobaculia bacterium]
MTASPRRTLAAPAVRHLVALAVLAASCGPSSQPAPTAGKPLDACAIFTAADAQAVLGEPEVVEMSSFLNEAKGTKDPSQCGYNAGSDPSIVLRLELRQSASPDQARSAHESARSLLATSGVRDVAGLGDGAFWVGGGIGQLHVLHGSVRLLITSQVGEGKDAVATAKAVAARVLSRM